MNLIQLLLEGITYKIPNFNFEWEEAIRYPEFKKLGKQAWINIASKGKEVSINSAKDINNTDANKPSSFRLLNKDKQKRTLLQLKSGTVEMPIIAVYPDGHKELLGGNTRLTALMYKNGKATVWMFDVPEDILEKVVNDKIVCDNCGWSWNIVDGGHDLYVCHKCNHDNTPQALENFKNTKINQQLKNYIEDYTDINLKLLKDLIKLKSKHPQQLDPRVGGNKFGYRGTTFNKEFINKLKVKSKSNGTTEYEVPSNLKITSKGQRGFLSFSTDEDVAKGFGHYSGYVDHKKSDDRVGGYVKVSLDNPNFILHPDYMGELSKDMEYSKESEKETLFVGNSYTPESIIIVDEKLYKENFKDGKKKGKSRPGRVKKSGASCNGSVTDLRRKAKNASGEKAKMYHWCANMKGGKKK